MSTSSFLEEEKNQHRTTTEASKSIHHHPFGWINRWIIYCPMITNTTIKNGKITQRQKLISKIAYASVIIMCIFFWIWDMVGEFVDYGFSLFTLVWCISISLLNISRLISVYYFYNHFTFYGTVTTDTNKTDIELQNKKMSSSGFRIPQYHTLTKTFSIRMKIILVVVIICLLAVNISATAQVFYEKDKPTGREIWKIVYGFFAIYFYDIPLFLTQFILSIFYCEGCIFVKALIENIDKSIKIDFDQLTKDYSSYRNEFKTKIDLLEKMIIARLCSLIAFVWIDITAIAEANTWLEGTDNSLWLLLMIFPFFEMIMAGNAATRKFHSFKKKLYSVGTQKDFFTVATMHYSNSQYLFLVDYVAAYPFLIKIFAKEVSVKNAAKVTVAFGIAKILTYLFKHKLV